MSTSDILLSKIVGESDQINDVRNSIARVARTKLPVLICGETGVGKDLAANVLHQLSDRANHPFVAINMIAIPDSLAIASLFGHERGAFTGATRHSTGMLGSADGGTIYLDEFEETPLEIQRLLVNFLDSGSYFPLGSTSRIQIDVRLIAGTRVPPHELNSVLPDLITHLSGFVLYIPPLRERPDDVPILVTHFMNQMSILNGNSKSFSDEAIEALKKYAFPGNIRELINIIERAVILSDDTIISHSSLRLPKEAQEPEREDAERLRIELDRTKRELAHLNRITLRFAHFQSGS